MTDTADKYGLAQTARLTGATPAQLRYWNRIGLVLYAGGGKPGKRCWYTFPDLVVLRAVVGLKASGCSIQRITRLWKYLQTLNVDPPEQRCACGHSATPPTSNGIRPALLPALRKAAALGIPRSEDLAGDVAKGQAIFVELLADVLEAVPPDRFWLADGVADRVAAQRDRLLQVG